MIKDHNIDLSKQLDFTDAKIKIDYRKRNRMKITIKLNKQETEGFTQFMNATKPTEETEENYARNIFFMGCETFQERLAEAVKNYTGDAPVIEGDAPVIEGDEPESVEVRTVGEAVPLSDLQDGTIEEV